jgi:hypothetical protein
MRLALVENFDSYTLLAEHPSERTPILERSRALMDHAIPKVHARMTASLHICREISRPMPERERLLELKIEFAEIVQKYLATSQP